MRDQPVIRPYKPDDERAVVQTWNRALWSDPISPEIWRTKVLLDPNFDPATCAVAEVDGAVRGFVLALTRQVPFYNEGLDPASAWMTAFGVDPASQRQGIGSALLGATLDQLRALGRTRLHVSPYVPNYFIPGVDVAAYGDGLQFLEQRGFVVTSRPLSMRVILTQFQVPTPIVEARTRLRSGGITVRRATPEDIVPVLQFVRDHFSWDWHREASGVFQDMFAGDPRQVDLFVAVRGHEVLGYAQHRAERFGPFGVRPESRSQGIGRVLLAETLLAMRAKQFHAAWFLWTSDNAARLYAQCGFEEARRFAVLSREL